MLTDHAIERLAIRLTDAERERVRRTLAAFVRAQPTGHHAVRVLELRHQRGIAWSDVSNGDEVWAIVRDGRIVTTMLRRSSQPATRETLRVERVWVAA